MVNLFRDVNVNENQVLCANKEDGKISSIISPKI